MQNSLEIGDDGSRTADAVVRSRLLERRNVLARAAASDGHRIAELLREVDSALDRLDGHAWGLCERCHDPVESDRLAADPLVRVCLGCLTEAERHALERDLELAASIQAALLPTRRVRRGGWDVAHRYLPLGPVSGDHCDVLQAPEAGAPMHVVLGDVAGKGVAAALVMAQLQAVLRALVGTAVGLDELVARANRLLSESTIPHSYATLVVARVHGDGAVELVNAGHPPALIVQDGATAEVSATGLPLGLFAGARYEVRRFRLAPEELLFLYSDGLTEARNGRGDDFGLVRLAGVVGALRGLDPEAVLDGCVQHETAFRGTEPRQDDLTVMAVRREG